MRRVIAPRPGLRGHRRCARREGLAKGWGSLVTRIAGATAGQLGRSSVLFVCRQVSRGLVGDPRALLNGPPRTVNQQLGQKRVGIRRYVSRYPRYREIVRGHLGRNFDDAETNTRQTCQGAISVAKRLARLDPCRQAKPRRATELKKLDHLIALPPTAQARDPPTVRRNYRANCQRKQKGWQRTTRWPSPHNGLRRS